MARLMETRSVTGSAGCHDEDEDAGDGGGGDADVGSKLFLYTRDAMYGLLLDLRKSGTFRTLPSE